MNSIDFYYFQEHAPFFIAIYILLALIFVALIINLSLLRRLEKERLLNEQQKTDLIKYKLAVQNAYDAIMITDGEGKLLFVNKIFENMTNIRIGDVIGRRIQDEFKDIVQPDFFEKMVVTVFKENRNFAGETYINRSEEDNFNIKMNISPIFDEYGKVVFCVAIMRDTTREKEIEQAKSDFVSIVSHQLRTPLAIIKGYVSMLIEGSFGVVPDTQKQIISKVNEANEHMVNLVSDLLNMSRIEAGRIKYNFEQAQLSDIVATIVEELTPQAKAKGLDLKFIEPAQPLPLVSVDKEKIRQVVINLIENSIKYTPQGSVTVKLSLVANKILFEVTDTGLGIKPEEKESLFVKFSRGADDSSKTLKIKGTGLGLYVGKMMITAHNGNIWVTSEGEDKGSSFFFELPVISK